MKLGSLIPAAVVVIALGTMSMQVAAQAALPRGDTAGFIAWQAAETGNSGPYDRDDWDNSLFGGASAGVYWTQHLKTELDFGASTSSTGYRTRPVVAGPRVVPQTSLIDSSRRTLGLSQQYQFYENAWFHPHVAVGANFTWERRTERVQPPYYLDPETRGPVFEPGWSEGPATEFAVRPFLAGGFKAYMTPRWFFRADARFAVKRGLEESHVRVGVGRDW